MPDAYFFYFFSAMEQCFWFLTNLALIYRWYTCSLKFLSLLVRKLASYLWTCPARLEVYFFFFNSTGWSMLEVTWSISEVCFKYTWSKFNRLKYTWRNLKYIWSMLQVYILEVFKYIYFRSILLVKVANDKNKFLHLSLPVILSQIYKILKLIIINTQKIF